MAAASIVARVKGYLVALGVLTDGQLLIGDTDDKPAPKTVSGDATLAKTGVLTISADALAATVSGRAKMADDFFNEATVDAKFVDGAIDGSDKIKAASIGADRLAPGVAADVDSGTVATARLLFANQPTHDDTIAIGADTYQFKLVATDIVVTNDAYIGVVISVVNAAGTRANLIAAINGTAGDVGLDKSDASPALSVGTESVFADEVGTTVRIQSADDVGGTPIAADPSLVLTESITDAADVWDIGSGANLNTVGGKAGAAREHAVSAQVAVTAAMLASGLKIDFPFTPTAFRVNARTATGVPAYANGAVTDTWTIVGTGVLFTPGTPGGGNLVATDLFQIEAWSG